MPKVQVIKRINMEDDAIHIQPGQQVQPEQLEHEQK